MLIPKSWRARTSGRPAERWVRFRLSDELHPLPQALPAWRRPERLGHRRRPSQGRGLLRGEGRACPVVASGLRLVTDTPSCGRVTDPHRSVGGFRSLYGGVPPRRRRRAGSRRRDPRRAPRRWPRPACRPGWTRDRSFRGGRRSRGRLRRGPRSGSRAEHCGMSRAVGTSASAMSCWIPPGADLYRARRHGASAGDGRELPVLVRRVRRDSPAGVRLAPIFERGGSSGGLRGRHFSATKPSSSSTTTRRPMSQPVSLLGRIVAGKSRRRIGRRGSPPAGRQNRGTQQGDQDFPNRMPGRYPSCSRTHKLRSRPAGTEGPSRALVNPRTSG